MLSKVLSVNSGGTPPGPASWPTWHSEQYSPNSISPANSCSVRIPPGSSLPLSPVPRPQIAAFLSGSSGSRAVMQARQYLSNRELNELTSDEAS